ncbi:MAG: transporter permease [Thermomicrobiales bacterium]|nr:transporter permease [Thermomicrobiales bacterium]
MTTAPLERDPPRGTPVLDAAKSALSSVGILPVLLVVAVVFFASQEARFYGTGNITNVLRQSTFLVIVTLGQALVLISGGFDLSVGAVIAVTSVVTARYMANFYAANPEPFIMTLGMASVGGGFALWYTGGSPVSGMPPLFTRTMGTGEWFGIDVPIYFAIGATLLVMFLISATPWGRYVYAIGGNTKAAYLSGIPVGVYTASVYVMCSLLAALSGILLTARTSSGEPNLGTEYPLESITAAVIGGVSLRGGEGRIIGAVLGAIFIRLLQNGMNLIRIESYIQTIAIGVILILAVVFDRVRDRWRVA